MISIFFAFFSFFIFISHFLFVLFAHPCLPCQAYNAFLFLRRRNLSYKGIIKGKHLSIVDASVVHKIVGTTHRRRAMTSRMPSRAPWQG